MGRLTTHVLDTARGCPARGVRVDLYRVDTEGGRSLLRTVVTTADGRSDEPLLAGREIVAGRYEMVFHVGSYFVTSGLVVVGQLPFLDQVPVRFAIAEPAGHYHVPLLVSPWGYTTYRGS